MRVLSVVYVQTERQSGVKHLSIERARRVNNVKWMSYKTNSGSDRRKSSKEEDVFMDQDRI